jgi:hypothetical protein
MVTVSCDHVSLRGSLGHVEELGFIATPTSGGDGSHARVLLDGMYLELDLVNAGESPLEATGWFLRPSDLGAARRALVRARFDVSKPELYEGHDGRWVDVSVLDGALAGASPILTIRIDLPRGSWPPQRVPEHPNGVVAIRSIEFEAPDPERAGRALAALGAAHSAGGLILGDGCELRLRHNPTAHAAVIATLQFRRRSGEDVVIDVAPCRA